MFSFVLPVVRQLKSHLNVGIWADLLLLDELFPVVVEFVDVHVQISHQPEKSRTNPVI